VLPARDAGNGNWEVQNPPLLGGNTYVLSPNTSGMETYVPVIPMTAGTTIAGFTHLARAPWIDFNTAGRTQEMNLSLLGLFDFANEQHVTPTGPDTTDGTNNVSLQPLPRFVRLPARPETYPNNMPVEEDIREYFMRWVKWFGDTTDCDGLRLDAVKHTPPEFFQSDFPNDPIDFNGTFQRDYKARRGFPNDTAHDALLFGEAFSGDINGVLLTYRNTGMYMLDFPLLFTAASSNGVFAQSGSGDIGQLSFPQGGANGLYNEFGGLGRTAGVSFVQSHDTPPPAAQPNAAYAYNLNRVGHTVVFYDGNNHDPASFVQPGRPDALGELGEKTILDLVDVRRRFARGGMWNRFVDSDYYVFERVVATPNGDFGATLLFAVTDNTTSEGRFGQFDSRPLVVTEFAPGTVLVEQTGNGADPTITVVDPSTVPMADQMRATSAYMMASNFPLPSRYGFVYFQVPAGPTHGYVAYAPRVPPANLSLASGAQPLAARSIQTTGLRHLPDGTAVPPSVISAGVLGAGATLSVSVASDATAAAVYLAIDGNQVALPGLSRSASTADNLYDGDYALPRTGSTAFALNGLDLSGLADGVHLVTVRAATGGAPSVYGIARAYVVIDRSVPAPDGGLIEPDAAMMMSLDASDAGLLLDSGATGSTDASSGADAAFSQDAAAAMCSAGGPAGVPDACNLCPDTPKGTPVDANGCPLVSAQTRADLDAIVQAILDERYDAMLDQNDDGKIDSVDFVIRANQVSP
jgi:hypothetical protein